MFGFLKKKIKGHTRTYKAGKEILTDATDAKRKPPSSHLHVNTSTHIKFQSGYQPWSLGYRACGISLLLGTHI